MRNLEAARILLEAALRDLRALYGMLDRDTFADEIFGFHVQQTAEKALKAWLSYFAVDFPYTHDLSLLLQELEDLECDVSEFWELVEFNLFAVQLRYDALVAVDEPINRQVAIAQVQSLYTTVENALTQ
ncbi:HEPN domain-containing protein [Leptolyngbya sp. PCC 6406]|uniref:HEPN domain-containing protein n=1 Tax=Leptolyngbya sp. PCC 6406 TaxID=1173264 RepID=UPI0002AC6BF1|nr:HEPN domain-containing protein [Leptolyngbya sp. PCC 6406]